jgi:UDP-glucose 4-epimerase
MARYLITGGAGFIGSHLVDALLADGHSVRVLDDLSSGSAGNLPRTVELQVVDVTSQEAVRRAFEEVEGCFHLAAIASVERCRQDWLRSHSVNLTGTVTVFEEARRASAISGHLVPVVYASSAAVYGNSSQIPISEHAPTSPTSAYGADKLGCDMHAGVANRIYNMSTVGLRFFNVYGPRQDPRSPYSGVISVFSDRILKKLPLELHGDGEQLRDFVYVEDAVGALRQAMQMASFGPAWRVFNICSGSGTTIKELGEAISRVVGRSFSPDYAPARAGDVRLSVGDPRLAREQLNFCTRISLCQGLSRTLDALAKADASATEPG